MGEKQVNEYTIVIPSCYTAAQWIIAYEIAKLLTEKGHRAAVTTMGTGVGRTLFIGNREGLSGNS